ncbi:MAG: hypothetical protein M1G31_33305 [Pseudanabaena sp. Salubria-1]|nr:hypothetical protein [Pseudanabaena sp. Salubria-1]
MPSVKRRVEAGFQQSRCEFLIAEMDGTMIPIVKQRQAKLMAKKLTVVRRVN